MTGRSAGNLTLVDCATVWEVKKELPIDGTNCRAVSYALLSLGRVKGSGLLVSGRGWVQAPARVLLAVVLLIVTSSAGLTVDSQVLAPYDAGQVAAVILMDNSGSMATSDPDGLRWQAASYFADFLSADGQASGVHHEAALIRFSDSPTRQLEFTDLVDAGDAVQKAIEDAERESPVGGWTVFSAALEQAASAIRQRGNSPSAPARYAVVVFTDGTAEPRDDQYFLMTETLRKLRRDVDCPVEGYVIAVGQGRGDEADWRLLFESDDSGQRYFPVAEIDDCFAAFGGIGASLLGLTTGSTVTISGTGELSVPPYLECMILTAFREEGGQVEVSPPLEEGQDSGGEPLKPLLSGKTYDIFFVSVPPHGAWKVTHQGPGSAWLLPSWSPPLLTPKRPRLVHSSRRPLELELDLVYPRSLEPVVVDPDFPLDLNVTAGTPSVGDQSVVVAPESAGRGGHVARFRSILVPRPVPGTWTVSLRLVNPIAARAIPSARRTVIVADLPVVSSLTVDTRLWTLGGTIKVEAAVDGFQEFLTDAALTVELIDARGRVRAVGPLSPAASGVGYEAVLSVPADIWESPTAAVSDGFLGTAQGLLASLSPVRGDAQINVVLSGFCQPPDAKVPLFYQDSASVDGRLAVPLVWPIAGLAGLLLVQFLAFWPGRPKVGELTWADPSGNGSSRNRFYRLRLPGRASVVAGPQMLTRFNWGGVQARAVVRSEGDYLAELSAGETYSGVPGDDTSWTVENSSLSGATSPPLGLAGHVLSILALVTTAAVSAGIVIPGLIALPGMLPKLLAGLYVLDLAGCGVLLWRGYDKQGPERNVG